MRRPISTLLGTTLLAILTASSGAGVSQHQSGDTVRWEVHDLGSNWRGQSVALGDEGSVLIAATVLDSSTVSVHSAASDESIVDYPFPDVTNIQVAAAKEAQSFAALVIREEENPDQSYPRLHVWNSVHGGPADWTFAFPSVQRVVPLSPFVSFDVRVSDDGQRIVAWFSDRDLNLVYLRVFHLDGTLELAMDLQARQGDLAIANQGRMTPDGARLLLGVGNKPTLIALPSGQILQEWGDRSDQSSGLAISRDGLAVAIGDRNRVDTYLESSQGGFAPQHQFTMLGERTGSAMDLDDDGSHLAFGVHWKNRDDKVQVRFHELATGQEVWRQEIDLPSNASSPRVSELRMNHDATRIVVGSFGARPAGPPAGFVLDGSGNTLSTFPTLGSILDLDYDPDGEVVAFATISPHIEGFHIGGSYVCADIRTAELRVDGVPRIGNVLTVDVNGEGTHTRVAVSTALGESITPYGASQLDLDSLVSLSPVLHLPSSGLSLQYAIPVNLNLVGIALHSQAAIIDTQLGSGFLSNRVSVRVLPR